MILQLRSSQRDRFGEAFFITPPLLSSPLLVVVVPITLILTYNFALIVRLFTFFYFVYVFQFTLYFFLYNLVITLTMSSTMIALSPSKLLYKKRYINHYFTIIFCYFLNQTIRTLTYKHKHRKNCIPMRFILQYIYRYIIVTVQ